MEKNQRKNTWKTKLKPKNTFSIEKKNWEWGREGEENVKTMKSSSGLHNPTDGVVVICDSLFVKFLGQYQKDKTLEI